MAERNDIPLMYPPNLVNYLHDQTRREEVTKLMVGIFRIFINCAYVEKRNKYHTEGFLNITTL